MWFSSKTLKPSFGVKLFTTQKTNEIMTPSASKGHTLDGFDVKLNENSVLDLFKKYEEIGFIYPAKQQLLAPHFRQIRKNWETLKGTPEDLLWVMTNDPKVEENFASISVWKSTNYGLLAQHLVSDGNPFLSLKVMLAAQYHAEHNFNNDQVRSSQNWFRPDNRYAFRIFASMYEKLGDQKASLLQFEYLHQPLDEIASIQQEKYQVEEVVGIDQELIAFVQQQCGNVFVRAEELDQKDIQLEKVTAQFRKYGLKRARRVFNIKSIKSQKVLACIVANRAPIGLNFSFFENRAYYILDKKLTPYERFTLTRVMNDQLKPFYADFEFQKIPIATDGITSEILKIHGAQFFKTYMQSIWLREGFPQWYEHINSFLTRIQNRMTRRSRQSG